MAKILIVEDDPLMLRMYQKVFTLEKYDVDIATNGEEAIAKVWQNPPPTLVLLDVMMPKMNGIEVLDRVKADPDKKNIPIVMLTNLAGQQDAENALLKGAVRYIVKSEHDPKQVVDMVKEILAGYTRNEVPQVATSLVQPNQSAASTPTSNPTNPAAPTQQNPSK